MAARCEAALDLHRAPGGVAEYASDQIWQAVAAAVSGAMASSGIAGGALRHAGEAMPGCADGPVAGGRAANPG